MPSYFPPAFGKSNVGAVEADVSKPSSPVAVNSSVQEVAGKQSPSSSRTNIGRILHFDIEDEKSLRPKLVHKQVVVGSIEHDDQEVVKSVSKEADNGVVGGSAQGGSFVEQQAKTDSYVDMPTANSFAILNRATEPDSNVILDASAKNIALGADLIHGHD
ncbi:unnamed protein product [Amaranthus hypochondriacus]